MCQAGGIYSHYDVCLSSPVFRSAPSPADKTAKVQKTVFMSIVIEFQPWFLDRQCLLN
uniref:Uncharacterized protein n=1 Tax=Leptospirillum sp. Group II '5-way CG' TaxID=419541 RepID=B6ASC3_9BACT|nr:MAG: Hypothetical protein CGL2_11216023 [Leptospirillum sp. Group II '5-way CG']